MTCVANDHEEVQNHKCMLGIYLSEKKDDTSVVIQSCFGEVMTLAPIILCKDIFKEK